MEGNEEMWKKKKKISKEMMNSASISSQKASPGSQVRSEISDHMIKIAIRRSRVLRGGSVTNLIFEIRS